jgi:DNA helicase-4
VVVGASVEEWPEEFRAEWDELRDALSQTVRALCNRANDVLWRLEVEGSKELFDSVEAQPLTEEQRQAATNFENRVQLVAAAGSGKTSVMVAKAAYAVKRGLVDPDRVLMLAFNKLAATELAERTRKAFQKAGLDPVALNIQTFHAFGLSVMGEITGIKPRLAPWVENESRMNTHARELIDRLRKSDKSFAVSWFMLKTVYFRDLGLFGEDSDIEDWDAVTKKRGKRTMAGDIVKSDEERMLANWLYVHDVEYRYEAKYVFETADALHSQYVPDFYYPEINVYHEHFALDAQGKPPQHFVGYSDGVAWKRKCHAKNGTTLFETTSAEIRSNDPFSRLEEMLRQNGLEPQLNSDKRPTGPEPISDANIVRLILTVLSHFKSNRMTISDLDKRLDDLSGQEGNIRRRFFFMVFSKFLAAWQKDLESQDYVDFHDMLVRAADEVDTSPESRRFDLILVDEFQDTSLARLGLVRALSNRRGVQVTVVGDDWQGINRFAGADLSVMTKFDTVFDEALTLALTRTFRCDQDICDFSSRFVMKNPAQQVKQVAGQARGQFPHLKVHLIDEVNSEEGLVQARRAEVRSIVENLKEAHAKPEFSVFILGRYKFEIEGLGGGNFGPDISVNAMTIHASKGLEADYVIIVGMNAGTTYGFPSKKTDDPLLSLVMPVPEIFPHAEERRLLYVATTRAKYGVYFISAVNNPSEFVTEAISDFSELVQAFGRRGDFGDLCPECNRPLIRRTNSKSGNEFLGCQGFPKCNYTRRLEGASPRTSS